MSSFKVDTDNLKMCGLTFKKWGENTQYLQEYASDYTRVNPSDTGVLQDMMDTHYDAHIQVIDSCKKLRPLLEHSGGELVKAAELYQKTDESEAERLDATYPEPNSTTPRPNPKHPNAGDITNQVMTPLVPPEPKDFKDPNSVMNTISSYLSPAAWILEVLQKTIGVNPAAEVTKTYTGDWKGVAQASEAYKTIAAYHEDLASGIQKNNSALMHTWQGNAAGTANDYFSTLTDILRNHRDGLNRLSEEYRDAAFGISQLAAATEGLIQSMFDNAFWAAVEVAAGAVLSETGVGPAVLWSIAALQCKSIVSSWNDLTAGFGKAQQIVQVASSMITRITSDTSHFKAHPIPENSYQHPGVD